MNVRTETVTPVVVPKASDILAARLRDRILAGTLAEGAQLPTERELVVESGLSRASVREALRILEVENLITTRPGRTGGSTVRRPGRESVSRSLELFVRSHGIRLEALLECREGVEPFLARLAATNRTEEELAEITELQARFVESVVDVPLYKRVNLDWHLAVARASHNEPLIALMEATAQAILDSSSYQEVTTDEMRHATVRVHGRIVQAIAAKDSKAAFARMERHVSAYSDLVRRHQLGVEA